MRGTPHEQKPDKDNLLKALLDALYGDDSHVWHDDGHLKFWGDEGSITVISRKLRPEERSLNFYLQGEINE